MKILFTPYYSSHFDYRVLSELAFEFKKKGHETLVLRNPISEKTLSNFCRSNNIDIIFQVNKFRSHNLKLPSNTRHISWFQDVYPSSFNISELDHKNGDLIYVFGEKKTLGFPDLKNVNIKTLNFGVSSFNLIEKLQTSKFKKDFSFVGYIPNLILHNDFRTIIGFIISEKIRRIPIFRNFKYIKLFNNLLSLNLPKTIFLEMLSLVELEYKPLSGDIKTEKLENLIFDYLNLPSYYQKQVKSSNVFNGDTVLPKRAYDFSYCMSASIGFLIKDYPRLLDRKFLIESALKVSNDVNLYGNGWEHYNEFKNYYRGYVYDKYDMYKIFRKSKINLMANTHGFGLHFRNLECMAAGGFYMMHDVIKKDKFNEDFLPDINYGHYTKDNLVEKLNYWLVEKEKRSKAIIENIKIINNKHLWMHRALQISKDLKI